MASTEPAPLVPIDYAGPMPTHAKATALSDGLWPTGIAACGGVAIVGLFAVTRFELLGVLGLVWLAIGGLLTLIGFILGVSYTIHSVRRGEANAFKIVLAVLAPIANLGVAWGCAFASFWLFDHPHFLR